MQHSCHAVEGDNTCCFVNPLGIASASTPPLHGLQQQSDQILRFYDNQTSERPTKELNPDIRHCCPNYPSRGPSINDVRKNLDPTSPCLKRDSPSTEISSSRCSRLLESCRQGQVGVVSKSSKKNSPNLGTAF